MTAGDRGGLGSASGAAVDREFGELEVLGYTGQRPTPLLGSTKNNIGLKYIYYH